MYFKRVIWFQIALFPDHSLGIQIVLITIEGQIRLAKYDHVSEWRKVAKSDEKVGKSREKFEKVEKSWEKWQKVEKVARCGYMCFYVAKVVLCG